MIIKGGGSVLAPGFGPPGYVSGWYYPTQAGVMDPASQTLTTTSTRKYYIPIYIFQSRAFINLAIYNSGVGDSGDKVAAAIYTHNPSYGPRVLKKDCGEITLTGSAIKNECTEFEVALTKGLWWLSLHCNAAMDLYAIRGQIGTGLLLRGQADLGVCALDAAGLDCVNYFPYVDVTYASTAPETATAPTAVTSKVPKVWLKAA